MRLSAAESSESLLSVLSAAAESCVASVEVSATLSVVEVLPVAACGAYK